MNSISLRATSAKLIGIVFFCIVLKANAFLCEVSTGQSFSSGSADVYVNLQPQIGLGQNLIVDLSNSVKCWYENGYNLSDDSGVYDIAHFSSGSDFSGLLQGMLGQLVFNGSTYPFPLTGDSVSIRFLPSSQDNPIFLPLRLYIKPVADFVVSGVFIHAGDRVAQLHMHKEWIGYDGGSYDPIDYTWNIISSGDVMVLLGTCDVSARDVNVVLPDYPGNAVDVPLSVHCAEDREVAYYLSGTTVTDNTSIFTNTAGLPAQGVGIQLSANGTPVAANTNIRLGVVGTSPVSLGLTANYAATGQGITAGDVQSVVGVTFVYP
ncbi:fimbrial protein [Citrobacter sp. Awk 4]|uniref:fimbrial protein n=1 Tax=Citrobacter sp. Awk 4 TaxID=2963955 RepID=UPI0023046702|nr:fimbrial protein [Citrobacter sp. Awk 4]MDA8480763.1 fimbrial protein [Citrobacter sp. Awk 4]